jgi:GcrA cell cycle regulator
MDSKPEMEDGEKSPVQLCMVHGNLLPRQDGKFTNNWTAEEETLLRRDWPVLSASQIAKLVGKSRNAVIGKAHRMQLDAKGPKRLLSEKPAVKKVRSQKAKPPTPIVVTVRIHSGPPISIMELGIRSCRAIVGSSEDGAALYCGAQTNPSKSFCEGHNAKFHIHPSRRRT